MPERSEWLLAGGVAKRNPRYHSAHQDAKNAKIGFLVDCFRVFLFSGMFSIPWVALTLNPRLRALGLKPSAFNLSGWIPPHTNNRITAKVMPTNRNAVAN